MQDSNRLLQFEEFFNVVKEKDICTNCTNIYFFVEICTKVLKELSTLKIKKNAIKSSFAQSYPHYQQKKWWKVWITLSQKRTGVLWINNENRFLSKKKLEKY